MDNIFLIRRIACRPIGDVMEFRTVLTDPTKLTAVSVTTGPQWFKLNYEIVLIIWRKLKMKFMKLPCRMPLLLFRFSRLNIRKPFPSHKLMTESSIIWLHRSIIIPIFFKWQQWIAVVVAMNSITGFKFQSNYYGCSQNKSLFTMIAVDPGWLQWDQWRNIYHLS